MRLTRLVVKGYRSIRDLDLPLGQVNVIVGHNGAGKSNLYRSLVLLAAAARGRLGRALADEGGMPSALWAGARKTRGRRKAPPVRLELGLDLGPLSYRLALGLPPPSHTTLFALDPEVKEETVDVPVPGRKRPARLLERKGASAWLRDEEGNRLAYPLELVTSESALSQLVDPRRFPELAALREAFSSWRVYHHFRTDADSPLRRPQTATRTFALADDGADLVAALQTVRENGDGDALDRAVQRALPSVEGLDIHPGEGGRLSLALHVRGVARPFALDELSDGTLRYLALCAALLTPRPPALLAFNEPESSLHPDLIEPLAELLHRASFNAQLWITTHSRALAESLAARAGEPPIDLEMREGQTCRVGEEPEPELLVFEGPGE